MVAPGFDNRSASVSGSPAFFTAILGLLLGSATSVYAQAPTVNLNGVIDAASSGTTVVAGGLASVFGANLASTTLSFGNVLPAPNNLGGSSVQIGGFAAPEIYVSPTQINIQIPWELQGQSSAQLTVTTANGTSPAVTVMLAPFAPALFFNGTNVPGQGDILNPNGTLNSVNSPAPAGTSVQIAATGLGAVTNQPTDGNAPSAVASVVNAVTVTIGGLPATVTSAKLCGPPSTCLSAVGTYVLTVLVPAAVTPGNAVNVVASMGSGPAVTSNTVTMAVASSTLTITTGPGLGSVPVGPVQIPLQATGGTGVGYTWTITGGALPAGLSVRGDGGPSYFPPGTTGGILGVATTTVSNASFTIQVTDSVNHTATRVLSMSVLAFAITEHYQFPDGVLNVPYAFTPSTLGASGPVTWSLPPNNTLPPGLQLNQATGQIFGTPSAAGNFGFALSAADSTGSVTGFYNILILGAGFSTGGDLGNFIQGSSVNTTLAGTGGTGPYTFSATSQPPPGLTLNANGQLTGTITGGNGSYRFSVQVKDSSNRTSTKNFVLNILATPTLLNLNYANPIEDATVGEPRTFPLNIFGGKSPYSWSISAGAPPPGLRLQTSSIPSNFNLGADDVAVMGNPTQLGTFTFTVRVQDSSNPPQVLLQPITIAVKTVANNYPSTNPTRGTPYSFYLQPLGATVPYGWNIISGSLPQGLSLNPGNGVISGTPTENGQFGPFINITAGGVTIGRYIGFNVQSPTNPQISISGATAMGDGIVNTQYNRTFFACCAPNGVTFSAVGPLPAGLTLNANGQLSGTPTIANRYNLEIHATDNNDPTNVAIRFFTLNITPLVPNTPVPLGTPSAVYGTTFTASGGTGALTWTLGPGTQLPPGLTFSTVNNNGQLAGTPTSAGSFNLNYIVKDTAGNSFNGFFTVNVFPNGVAPPNFTVGPNLGTWPIGEVQDQLTANGGDNITYTWSVFSGSLPPGLSLRTDKPGFFSAQAQAGIIGVATTPGTYNFTLAVTSGGQTSYEFCTMRITSLTNMENTGYRLPDAFLSNQFSYTFKALNAAGAVTFGSPNNLPPGMTLSNTGTLSGTPTTAGFYNFSFTINDTVDTVTVGAAVDVFAVNITSAAVLPNATQNAAYTPFQFTASGGTGPYTFTASFLPSGLSVSPAGVLSGTVTGGPGRYGISVTAKDNNGTTHSMNAGLTVIGVPPTEPFIQPYGNFDDCSYGITCTRGVAVNNGGTAPFTWTVSGLPPGMNYRFGYGTTGPNITPSDVELWGAPLAVGTFNVTAVVTDFNGIMATQTFPLTVSRLFVDGGDFLPGGTRGTAYSKLLRVIGGTPAASAPLYGTQITEGILPAGLNLTGMTVSGTPIENGNFQPRLTFTDSTSAPSGGPYTLHITEGIGIGNGTSTIGISTFNFDTTGSVTDIVNYLPVSAGIGTQLGCGVTCNWTVIGGALPPGISLSASGSINGVAGNPPGTYTFTVQAVDVNNAANIGVRQLTIVVTPLNITNTSPLQYAVANSPYTLQLTSNPAGATFSLVPEYYLPPGLTMDATGKISGTPTTTGQYIFYVMAVDGSNNVMIKQFSLSVWTKYPPLFLGTGPNVGPDSPGSHTTQLTATGGKPPYHYSFSPGAPAVPNFRVQDGGQLASNFTVPQAPVTTGGFMGVSPGAGNFPTSLRVTDSDGNTFDRAITLINSSLTILNTNNPPSAVVNSQYSYTFVGFGGTGTYTWSATGLPNGITIGSSTGTISGAPTVSGSFGITITATDTAGTAEPFSYTLTAYPYAITTGQVLPQGTIGTAYSQTLTAAGCGSNCTWSITSGSLPGGLALTAATGLISGTPTGFSNSSFTVQVSGSNGVVTRQFALFVPFNTPQPLFISSNLNIASTTVGSGFSTSLSVQGGTPPYVWSVAAGSSLPPGVSLTGPGETLAFNFSPGFTYLYGKPMAVNNNTFTLQVSDAASNTTTQTFTWNVTRLNFNMNTFPFGGTAGTYGAATQVPTYGQPYSQQLLVLGGSGNYTTWTHLTPMPPGLSLDPNTGLVSGTPAATGSFSPQIQVSDDAGNTHFQTITFNVVSGTASTLNFGTGPNLGNFSSGGSNVFNLNPSGGTGPYTITVLDALPPGCAIETGNSLLGNANGIYDLICAYLGTQTYTFTIKATDTLGNFGVRQMTINVFPQQLFTTTALANGSVGAPYSQQLVAWDNAGTVSWSIAPGSALPPGMTLTGATLGGTPTTAGSYSFQLTYTDSSTSLGINATFSIKISTITITNPTIIPAQPEFLVPFSYQFTATGGGAPKTWSATNIPSGLTLNPSTGLLSGSVTTNGTFPMTVTVTDGSSTVSKSCVIYPHYTTRQVLSNSATVVPESRVGQSYSFTFNNVTGGTPPYTWSAGPGVPPGLNLYDAFSISPNLTPGTTVLAGEPSAVGVYTFDLTLRDNAGATTTRTFTVNVSPITIEGGGLPNGTINVAYSRQFTAVGGTGPYTFTYVPALINVPMFPPGINGSPSGLINGTPTSTGTFSFYVTATDSLGNHYRNLNSISVTNANGLSLNTNPIPSGFLQAGIGFNFLQYGTNQAGNFTFTLQSGNFPPGLTLTPSGTIYGAPSNVGVFNYTIRATDNSNAANFADHQYTSEVYPMQFHINEVPIPPVTLGVPMTNYQFSVVGGTAPYTFTTFPFLSPLPAGLNLDVHGNLTGTPTQSGAYGFQILVTDSAGHSAYLSSGTLRVLLPGQKIPIFGDTGGAPPGSTGSPYAIAGVDSSWAGNLPIAITLDSGFSLPPGMKILPGVNGAPDYLAGIPTTAGDYPFQILLTDAAGQIGRSSVNFSVTPVAITPFRPPDGVVGVAYSSPPVTISGGTPPYTISTGNGSDMPPGLSLSATGALTGTPTVPGHFGIELVVTDSAVPANTAFGNYHLVIDQAGANPGISIRPANPIQISYVRTSPAPAPVPLNIATTSDPLAFSAVMQGIPGLTLSAASGTAPAVLTLNLDPTGLAAGTYSGVVSVYSQAAYNIGDYLPVELTITDPPPCTYSLIPTGGPVPANGGSGSFTVSTGSACAWAATPSDSFIHNVVPASGTGTTAIQFTVDPNGAGAPSRNGSISVGGQTYSISQLGSTCSLVITPNAVTATFAGGTATVNVGTNAGCAWTATGLNASPAGGTGPGFVTFSVGPTANANTQTLNASVKLTATGVSSAFTVAQTGVGCTVTLGAATADVSYSGGSGAVNVTVPAGCSYTTANIPGWVSITNGATGNSSGPVNYSVMPNSTTVSRSGTLNIGDKSFTITQDPTPCSVTVDASTSGSPFGSGGGVGALAVTANGSNCTWTASSPVPWVTVAPSFGSGNGTINLNATSNAASTTSRSTNLTVAGQSVAVTQGGTICNFTLGSSNASIPFGGGTGTVSVTAPAACAWSSSQDASAPWLTISSSGSGGTSNVVFVAAANGTSSARSGTLTIAGQSFAVNEAAGPCNYILNGTNTTLAAAGAAGLFTFSTGTSGCSATALSFANWLTVSTTSSLDGKSGTVNFTAAANPSGSTRSGTIQFGGQTYTVNQTGAACAFNLSSYGVPLGKVGGAGSVLGSPSAQGCAAPSTGVDQPGIVSLGALTGPLGNIYTLPFTVATYNSTLTGIRRMIISFGGQLFVVKQTSW